jgi:hypothetical protein
LSPGENGDGFFLDGERAAGSFSSGSPSLSTDTAMKVKVLSLLLASSALAGPLSAEESRTLKVHLVGANNDSPYAFVRAKFEPGEVTDPWSVRFADESGKEVPFFVHDSITWRVARQGRADWGQRYALLGQSDPALDAEPPALYAVACRTINQGARWQLDACYHELAVGQSLPTLPLWLTAGFAVALELENNYETTCRVLRLP